MKTNNTLLALTALLAPLTQPCAADSQDAAVLRRVADGVLKQTTRRLIDRGTGENSESWLKTSCTGMLTYGIARGVNEGWLDASFAGTARKGWKALQTKVTADGDLLDVCGSTDTGDLKYYLNRPRLQGDLHGFGSFLLAGAEIARLQSKNGDR